MSDSISIDVTRVVTSYDGEPVKVQGDDEAVFVELVKWIDLTQPEPDRTRALLWLRKVGQHFKDSQGDLTLRKALCQALMGVYEDERKLDGEKKVKRHLLASRIYQDDVVKLAREDVTELKELVNKCYPQPAITAAIWQILETESAKAMLGDGRKEEDDG